MDMIHSQIITRRHGAKKNTRRKRFRNTLTLCIRLVRDALGMVVIIGLFAYAALSSLDKNIYPGAEILNQSECGNILEIAIDPNIDDGTDTGCLETAKIIQRICQDGYRVYYKTCVFDLDQANDLVSLNGSPGI